MPPLFTKLNKILAKIGIYFIHSCDFCFQIFTLLSSLTMSLELLTFLIILYAPVFFLTTSERAKEKIVHLKYNSSAVTNVDNL
ncbi:GPN-loop GTPase 3 [Iris pallida]|uniref:GPN-loop GTPase 3 n=1 Tax=Iris pallida TaxID=29817 RepID=A0AAX6HH89_IRIPA|nr:GPN-loop GTPase 3 [Iris pallida]